MERFNAFKINDPRSRKMLTAIFTYEDSFIDQGLRLYSFRQALHLYLKQHGYQTIVFYNTATGYFSYEKEMLEQFFTKVTEAGTQDGQPTGGQEVTTTPEQRGRLRMGRLMGRTRRHEPGARDIPEGPVPVSHPQHNLYLNEQTQTWHVKGKGDRVANMDEMAYNLSARRHLAIVVEASESAPEFDHQDFLETAVKNAAGESEINTANINDNRLIIAVNAESCRGRIMQLFDPQRPPHPSIFMQGFFRNYFVYLPKNSQHEILNTKNSFPLPSVTAADVRRIMMRARMDSGTSKQVDWTQLDNICEQFAFREQQTLRDLYHLMKNKDSYTCDAFKAEGIKRRGDQEKSLNELIGLSEVKRQIQVLRERIALANERHEDISSMNLHLVFYGNPGTGKTTVARIVAGIYKDLGLLSKGHLVEVTREHLVAGYVGQSAIKTSNVIDSALDGVLFVDEAYRLADGGENDFGKEAVDTILARMENDRHRLVVIFAGYEADMERLYRLNDGIPSRINTYINFADYNADELKEIFLKQARKKYIITPEVERVLEAAISYALAYPSRTKEEGYKFGNARWVRNLMEKVDYRVASRFRISDASRLIPDDFAINDMKELQGFVPNSEGGGSSNEPSNIDKLQAMIGLASVKRELQVLIDEADSQRRHREVGLDDGGETLSRHMVFSGNPGTGKTTVARLMGGIYHDLGLLSKGHVVEIQNRGLLVEGYQGQTGKRVNAVVDSAKGGVLFIDEIYSLVQSQHDDFGREALNTLITRIENDRGDMVVILAGYASLMNEFFVHNPGLKSRFNKYINFEDYTADELVQIIIDILRKKQLEPDETAIDRIRTYVASKLPLRPEDGNGRWGRNLAEWIVVAHRQRERRENITTRQELTHCSLADVEAGIAVFSDNQLNSSIGNSDLSSNLITRNMQ